MANLTITVDSELLKRARIRALEQGTSVNAAIREFLEEFAGRDAERVKKLRALLRQSTAAKSSREGRRWSRDELHER